MEPQNGIRYGSLLYLQMQKGNHSTSLVASKARQWPQMVRLARTGHPYLSTLTLIRGQAKRACPTRQFGKIDAPVREGLGTAAGQG